ncbi:MAG: Polysaccharide deacetylase, PdaB family [Parcubacteria group bacterium GW2011_GWF2_38_8]|nr:MAG: Polysaccharide deacetylase, PdaB family [Parcubacteria group bacterium GW2011_GWF2_38_8]
MFFHGNKNKKEIAITFDDGPSEETREILEILKRNEVKATFFIVGKMIDGKKDIIERVKEDGHEFGNHTFSHKRLWFKSRKFVEEEIKKCDEELQKIGITTNLFRFPEFKFGPTALLACKKLKRKVVFGSPMYDWVSYDFLNPYFKKKKDIKGLSRTKKVIKNVLSKTRNGSIIILHDYLQGIGPHKELAEILEIVLPELKKRGFEFVVISKLLFD